MASYWDPIRKMLGCPDDAAAAGDGTVIAILKYIRSQLAGAITVVGPIEVEQDTHDDLNCNANMQVGNTDVGPANQVPVSVADGDDVAEGTTTDAAASSTVAEDATARTGIGLWKGIKNILILMNAKFAALGQAAMAASMPVVIASDQTDVPVSTDGDTISQTPAITAGAYAAGDAVGGLLTFANAARVSGGGGVIKDIIILDDAGQDAEMEIWLFRETFVAMADNAAWAPSEADLRKLVAIVSTSDGAWFAAGTPSVARVEVSQRYDLVATSMFGQLVTRGTPTFAATDDVTCIVGLLQD